MEFHLRQTTIIRTGKALLETSVCECVFLHAYTRTHTHAHTHTPIFIFILLIRGLHKAYESIKLKDTFVQRQQFFTVCIFHKMVKVFVNMFSYSTLFGTQAAAWWWQQQQRVPADPRKESHTQGLPPFLPLGHHCFHFS